jgi:hypothetical protein
MKNLSIISKQILLILPFVLSLNSLVNGATYFLIVEGINKDVDEIQSKSRAVMQLQKAATQKLNIPRKNLILLNYKGSLVTKADGFSTAAAIEKVLLTLSEKIRPSDRFIFYYLGQANAVKGMLRLNLPGLDITGEDLARWIDPIKTSNMLIILDCPNAGIAVKPLAHSGRIILVSSRADQPYSPQFCEYFIPAITALQSDLNQDGKISLLETLQQTARRLDQFYLDRQQVKHENFLLEDDGDAVPNQQPWLYHENKSDGHNASKFFWKG